MTDATASSTPKKAKEPWAIDYDLKDEKTRPLKDALDRAQQFNYRIRDEPARIDLVELRITVLDEHGNSTMIEVKRMRLVPNTDQYGVSTTTTSNLQGDETSSETVVERSVVVSDFDGVEEPER